MHELLAVGKSMMLEMVCNLTVPVHQPVPLQHIEELVTSTADPTSQEQQQQQQQQQCSQAATPDQIAEETPDQIAEELVAWQDYEIEGVGCHEEGNLRTRVRQGPP